MSEEQPETPVSSPQEFLPAPRDTGGPRVRGPELSTLVAVRKELSKVYRQVRAGKIRSEEGSKLCYMLGQLKTVVEAVEIQQHVADRLDQLEQARGVPALRLRAEAEEQVQ
jgi:hypothetical protein